MTRVSRTLGMVVLGVDGHQVEVEACLSEGVPGIAIVGLADTAVGEARDRARAAILTSGFEWPNRKITVGLSPAGLPKRGSSLDLAIAVSVLAAAGQVPLTRIRDVAFVGELGLDGRVRPVLGVLVAALKASRDGISTLVVPAANRAEAQLVPELRVIGVRSLAQLAGLLLRSPHDGPIEFPEDDPDDDAPSREPGSNTRLPIGAQETLDLADVRGQAMARLALEVAAAGGHHLSMVGPPGVGKTMLAERLPGLLPDLGRNEALEVTAVHSVMGRLDGDRPGIGPLLVRPPLAAPHHTTTYVAMVGGGSGATARAGLISLAHNGVLFMDEAPEFDARVLEALRQPLESGEVTIARANFLVRLPARFQLILAANPCPCGRAGQRDNECTCSPMQRRRYASKLSGPLMDRIDVQLAVTKPSRADLEFDVTPESTSVVAQRVLEARERATHRLRRTPWKLGAHVPGPVLRRNFPLGDAGAPVLAAVRAGRLSSRGLDRVTRVAWTLADLAGLDRPGDTEVGKALVLRPAAMPGVAA